MVAPRFEKLSDKYPGVHFLKVDVDEQRAVASTHNVRAMPTFQFFKNGKRLEEVVGADINKVERLVESLASGSGGASGFPSSGGRVLGSGASTSGSSSSTGGVAGAGFLGLTPMQQQYAILACLALALVYMYFQQNA
ncbi:hypothetical protein HDU76_012411 [Blyttiomyces sp. JEL0837]|nr:hypothetical protein HDU76_012411 [Blyttiomyces sp. JEL0837]